MLLYRATIPSGENIVDVSNLNIPVNFKATFKVKTKSTVGTMGGIYIGSNSNNRIFIGSSGRDGAMGIYVYNNGSAVNTVYQFNVYSTNQVIETVYTYNDGVQTLTANNVTKTLTNSSITARTYLLLKSDNTEVTDLIIEPL